jgi:hypothetical protein
VHPTVAQVDAFHGGKPVAICKLLWPTEMRDEATTLANARLIAAAPDLLEALRQVVAIGLGQQDTAEEEHAAESAMKTASSAIARAGAKP